MKTNLKTSIFVFVSFIVFTAVGAQNKIAKKETKNANTITMRWDKNTPEQEMNDDIKALKEAGVTVKYSNLKRNKEGQITSLKIEYKDEEGNTGSQEYNGTSPIADIYLFKDGNQTGFGQNTTNNRIAFQDFDWNFDKENAFGFKQGGSQKSKIIIKKDGKDPLIIEDGEVIKGAEGYSEEEINKIKKDQKFGLGENNSFQFNFNSDDLNKMQEQMKIQMERLKPGATEFMWKENDTDTTDPDYKKAKEEMLKAKEEMQKAREELEKSRQEMQKAKSELKMRKA
ncbi:hypothetical protein EQG63_07750 [Flavobacterium amnicola]|uniref:Uncharacterized protein n=1 Tax=Flavobacterium amnicola TaxID=2506422 RepID=A0A4Q1K3L9_9FLAO|nr:hypothetical protein [Flavobacterium amnicola]RXR19327.1 hypothetical protein EQG63_07750 [Flavobacterium amnicola]